MLWLLSPCLFSSFAIFLHSGPLCFHFLQLAWASEEHCCVQSVRTASILLPLHTGKAGSAWELHPSPTLKVDLVFDECSSLYNILATALWGVVALFQQCPLKDSFKSTSCGTSSFHFFYFLMPLLVVLNTVPDKPYYISTWCLLLGSWPKTAAPSHLKSRLFQDHWRVVSLCGSQRWLSSMRDLFYVWTYIYN